MAWVQPTCTRSQVNAAGEKLIQAPTVPTWAEVQALDAAMAAINNWRSAHRYPLNAIQVAVRQRALRIDTRAIVPQRIKRLPAIEAKLRLQDGMQLARMHDIGGCRAIVRDIHSIDQIVAACEEAAKDTRRSRIVKKYDYIANPKLDGYRGVHLVYQYHTEVERLKVYEGMRIEAQIRSRRQHTFATAVETAAIFTDQPLKSIRAKLEDDRWREFFRHMGAAFAIWEKTAPVPETPTAKRQLSRAIRSLASDLQVETVLTNWGATVQKLQMHSKDAKMFLLVLDTEAKTTDVIGFSTSDVPKTDAEYLEYEKRFRGKPSHQVVLVRTDSVDALRASYPNFYLDTTAFITAMKEAMRGL